MHADFVDDAARMLRAAAPGDLSRVSEAAAVLAHGDHLLVQVFREARAAGRSWSQIAEALQTSTAIARQRRGPPRHGVERGEPQGSAARPVQTCGELAGQLAWASGALVGPLCGGVGVELAAAKDGRAPLVHEQVLGSRLDRGAIA